MLHRQKIITLGVAGLVIVAAVAVAEFVVVAAAARAARRALLSCWLGGRCARMSVLPVDEAVPALDDPEATTLIDLNDDILDNTTRNGTTSR